MQLNQKNLSQAAIADGLPQPRRFFSVAAVLLGIIVMVTDSSMVAAALPYLAQQLEISDRTGIWLVSAYQMIIVVTVLPFAALGEAWGYHRVFRCGLLSFIIGAVCCATATSLPPLMLGRLLEGCGAAAIYATMAAVLRFSVPANKMGSAIGNNSLVVGLSAAAGPSLGVMIAAYFSWHALFLVAIPFAVLAGLCTLALPIIPRGHNRMRPASALISVLALTGLVFAIDTFPADPIKALPLFVCAIGLGTILIRIEMRQATHFVPIDLLRNPITRLAAAASLCMFMSQMVSSIALPFYMMRSLGKSLGEMGVLLALWPIAVATMAAVSGWLSDRLSTGVLASLGSGLLSFSLFAIAFWPHPHVLLLSSLCFICGTGFGLFQSPNNRAMILSAPRSRTAGAGAVQALARQLGQSMGAAGTAGVFNLLPGSDGGWVLVMAAFAAAMGFLLSIKRALSAAQV